jgi:sugar lactone lactonase YvrE
MSSMESAQLKPRVLLDGLAYVESPRWHDGRLWFAHWGAGQIIAVDVDGLSEVVGEGPPGFGWSIAWLPDGRRLVTGEQLMRREPDGSMVQHADLSGLSGDWNELVVDGRGNIYVNGLRVRSRAGGSARNHRAGHPGWFGSPGCGRHRFS